MFGDQMYVLGSDTCWSYGCTKCQTRHFEYEAVYEDHGHFSDKHGLRIVPVPLTKTEDGR